MASRYEYILRATKAVGGRLNLPHTAMLTGNQAPPEYMARSPDDGH